MDAWVCNCVLTVAQLSLLFSFDDSGQTKMDYESMSVEHFN